MSNLGKVDKPPDPPDLDGEFCGFDYDENPNGVISDDSSQDSNNNVNSPYHVTDTMMATAGESISNTTNSEITSFVFGNSHKPLPVQVHQNKVRVLWEIPLKRLIV